MNLDRIRLELARDKDFPDGSSRHGYELVLPLDAQGKIDLERWKQTRERCRVHRFWRGEDDEVGHMVRTRPGFAWASTASSPASMSPSRSMTARCALSAWCRSVPSDADM